jgi:hypothetical protein
LQELYTRWLPDAVSARLIINGVQGLPRLTSSGSNHRLNAGAEASDTMDTIMHNAIERFIRDELGCQCPDAVFRRLGVETCPEAFGYWPQGRLISVGGRLLILVLHSDDTGLLHRTLGGLLETGRCLRDARGFNRFRLVIATSSADTLGPSLRQCFDRSEGRDGRMHLHVIAPEQVPVMPDRAVPDGLKG